MNDQKRVFPIKSPPPRDQITGLAIGKLVGTKADGGIIVEYEDNHEGTNVARVTSSAREKLRHMEIGQEVLVGFVGGAPSLPIILDTLSQPEETVGPEIDVDRKALVLEARDEVVIRCGEASITLTSAGKVLIKGCYLVSRSSGANCIKGSSVRIN